MFFQYLTPKILADSTEHLQQNQNFSKRKSTLLSKLTFWWLTPLLWQGFWEPLELDDFGKLPEKETARFHYDQFLFIYHNRSKVSFLWYFFNFFFKFLDK